VRCIATIDHLPARRVAHLSTKPIHITEHCGRSRADDKIVAEVGLEEVLKAQAYLLFYVKQGEEQQQWPQKEVAVEIVEIVEDEEEQQE
jgi:hypothetical protein